MSTLDVVAYAGEEFGGVKRQLPRHRGGASAQVMADGLRSSSATRGEERVRERLRGHHRLRRGRQRHRQGHGDARRRGDVVDKPIVSASTGTTPPKGAGSSTRPSTTWSNWWTPWTRLRPASPSCARTGRTTDMAIFLTRTPASWCRASPVPRGQAHPPHGGRWLQHRRRCDPR